MGEIPGGGGGGGVVPGGPGGPGVPDRPVVWGVPVVPGGRAVVRRPGPA